MKEPFSRYKQLQPNQGLGNKADSLLLRSTSVFHSHVPTLHTATNILSHVLKVKCPSLRCKETILLLCPDCRKGGLMPSNDPFSLFCPSCHHSFKHLLCSCGFKLKASVVTEKQDSLLHLRQRAEQGQLFAVIALSLLTLLFVWMMLQLQPPLLFRAMIEK